MSNWFFWFHYHAILPKERPNESSDVAFEVSCHDLSPLEQRIDADGVRVVAISTVPLTDDSSTLCDAVVDIVEANTFHYRRKQERFHSGSDAHVR